MAKFKYIKGSASDFEGAPDWATVVFGSLLEEHHGFAEKWEKGSKYVTKISMTEDNLKGWVDKGIVIAQREPMEYDHLNDFPLVSEKYPNRDVVNHPSHYTQGGIECIDAIKAATVGKEPMEAVCVANVVKYLWRYEEKNGLEDVKKARWYLERLIKEMEE